MCFFSNYPGKNTINPEGKTMLSDCCKDYTSYNQATKYYYCNTCKKHVKKFTLNSSSLITHVRIRQGIYRKYILYNSF